MRRGTGISPHGCGEVKPLTEFPEHSDWICASCMTAYRNRQNRSSTERGWETRMWAKYRLRPEDYDRMREEQDFRCAVCNVHETEVDQSQYGRPRLDGADKYHRTTLVVDHCHRSNIVRRLVCSPCNQGMGHFDDDIARLEAAIAYLRAHSHLVAGQRRERVMPLAHVEQDVSHLCRSGRHPKVVGARTCKECQRASERRSRSKRATEPTA